jgi:hypothetical protein
MAEQYIILFVAGMFIFSIIVMAFVMKMLAKFGWSKLVDKYGYVGEFEGVKMGTVGMHIGTAQYNGSIIMYLGSEGIYLKPLKIFRFSHPPIMIPVSVINNLPGGFDEALKNGSMMISEKPKAVVFFSPKIIIKLRNASKNT